MMGSKMRVFFTAVVVTILSGMGFCADPANQQVIDIFGDGKLSPGITLENARVEGKEIVTVPMGKPWGNSAFTVKGLDIDIAQLDLAQIHFRLVAEGNQNQKPNYAEVHVDTTSKRRLYIEWFPFRAYDPKSPHYMTKSCDYSPIYGSNPKGKDYGKITGFRVLIGPPKAMVMRFSAIQILIDKSFADRYPDDPKPDPNWKTGKIDNVYAISGSQRVDQGDFESPLAKGNSVWKDGIIKISGARNEIVPFQVVMEVPAGGDGVNDVNVRYAGVKNGSDSIDNSHAADPKDIYNYVGRPIQLYRARYISLANSDKYFPEMLIPFEAQWGGTPFSIFPGKTQSVWVDTYISKDAKAGLYTGTVDILVGKKVVKSLPVELTVHDFELPNKPSIIAPMWCGDGAIAKHRVEGDARKKLEANYRRFMRRNYTGYLDGIGPVVSDKEMNDPAVWRLRSGNTYTREEGYEGTGYGLPTPMIFFTMYGGGVNPFDGPGEYGDEKSWHEGLLRLKTLVDKYAPGATIAWYAWDEPSHSFVGGMDAFTKWMNTVGPHVDSFNKKYDADVKVYVTTDINTARNVPSLSIYSANADQVDEMHQKGHINAHYNGPQQLGLAAAANRIVGWQAYARKADFWWFWEACSYRPGFDVYQDPYNFSNQYGEIRAGLGSFVYPGTDGYIAKRSPGLNGPVPGIRFFNWRQGFIDYEYLILAAEKNPSTVNTIVTELLPQSEPIGKPRLSGFPRDEQYAAARDALVKIIQKNAARATND
ncbi:MAG: DUF4091 domain-containing protein [Deltaproteobacteria bacterium]|nr:DUF4091 domain-containing protein [Deltaproteobacteria bacterium]